MVIADVLEGRRAWWVETGDSFEVLPTLPAGCCDCVVTDPPYALSFMGRDWDKFTPGRFQEWCGGWAELLLHVVKPGGYMLCFGGTRTYHRLTCAVEDAGWEVRDCLMWLYGSGWPKGKSCLKPAYEPILLARRPGPRVLPLGVEECRVGAEALAAHVGGKSREGRKYGRGTGIPPIPAGANPHFGRWPANVVLDEEAALLLDGQSGEVSYNQAGVFGVNRRDYGGIYGGGNGIPKDGRAVIGYGDRGGASRFFYCPKADRKDRGTGNGHPTVKPFDLMCWLVKLVCPPGGLVLDPFAGSGSTGVACRSLDRRFLGVELQADYVTIARSRIADVAPLLDAAPPSSPEEARPAAPPASGLFDSVGGAQ